MITLAFLPRKLAFRFKRPSNQAKVIINNISLKELKHGNLGVLKKTAICTHVELQVETSTKEKAIMICSVKSLIIVVDLLKQHLIAHPFTHSLPRMKFHQWWFPTCLSSSHHYHQSWKEYKVRILFSRNTKNKKVQGKSCGPN